MELKTKDFEIVEIGDKGEHKVFCYNKNLCRRLNQILNHYPDYTFKEGDEAIFRFPANKMVSVKLALKIKN